MMLNVACELQPYSLVPENQRKNLNCQVSKGIIRHTGEVIYVQIAISNLPADFWTKQPHEFPTCPFHTLLCYDISWLGFTVKWSFLNIRFSQTKGSGKTESYRNILTIHFQRHQFKILTIQHQGRMATCDPKKEIVIPSSFDKATQGPLWHRRVQICLQHSTSEQALTRSGHNTDLGWNKCLLLSQLKFQIHLYN